MSIASRSFFLAVASRFRANAAGSMGTLLALAMPMLFGVVGGAIDYSSISQQRARVQSVTDSTALAVAREMTLTAMSPSQITASVQRYSADVGASLGLTNFTSTGAMTPDSQGVKVQITARIVTQFGIIEAVSGVSEISGHAIARLGQQSKLCLLALDELAVTKNNKAKPGAPTIGIELQNNSRMTANNCLVHSNAKTAESVVLKTGAQATVSVLCAVGGVRNDGGILVGDALGSCPNYTDPLATRPLPAVAKSVKPAKTACGAKKDYADIVYDTGVHRLTPKVNCGNITIMGTAEVRLDPGIHVFQGTLIVQGDASLIGSNVGLMFTRGGAKDQIAKFAFLGNSYIELTAPVAGEMQGLLIWEEKEGAKQEANIGGANYHQINTARAKTLTGTIYLPAGHLLIDAPVQIAERSEYTVLVVSRLDLSDGPNLVLNSNYAGSMIPVPKGLGTIGSRNIRLANQ